MTAKAFIPRWRLLTGTINTKHRLFRLHSGVELAPHCPHCHDAFEDEFHFIVDCPTKWDFWSRLLTELNLLDRFSSSLHIWSALTCFTLLETRDTVAPSITTLFGSVVATLWRYHYHCHFQQELWSTTAALRLFHTEQRYFISKFISNSFSTAENSSTV